MQADFLFAIAILIISVMLHEISHGHVANLLGDPTAKYANRLTLNPLRHIEIFGSIILPVITYLLGGFILGWAKPVPYNPYNLKNQKWGPAIIAVAGPLANMFIALVFGMIIRFRTELIFLPDAFFQISTAVIFLNLMLAVFNLMPIPPLDGSKILFAFLPYKWRNIQFIFEKYGFFLVLIFVFFIWQILFLPFVADLFKLITGY